MPPAQQPMPPGPARSRMDVLRETETMVTPRNPIDWPAAFRSVALSVVIGVGVIIVALGVWFLAAVMMARLA